MLDALIVATVLATGALLAMPRLANARMWRATATPLASIIGSGFLVLGPILDASYGAWAPLAMAALCVAAWLFGAAIRYNIRAIDAGGRSVTEDRLDTLSSWALAFAYTISVAYYLNLFGAFAVSLTPFDDRGSARLVTSVVMLAILGIGWSLGFRALERSEQISVGLKLAIIAGLLLGLGGYFGGQAMDGALLLNPVTLGPWAAITTGFGLIVTVQGFETSRYLGVTYDAPTRARSMRLAQALSTAIYMTYIGFIAYAFPAGSVELDETAVIDMMRVVAVTLPPLLVAAALAAQFSAAVADTGGSGGLVHELTAKRVSPRLAYAALIGLGLVMTWTLDVFQIISYASRAFAAYYALQAAIATVAARRAGAPAWRTASFAALALLGAAIAVLGQPVE